MSDEVVPTDEETPLADAEAAEAQGVAEIEMTAAPMPSDEATELDRQTWDDLADEERRALEEISVEHERAAGPAAGTPLSANFTLSEFHCCRGHCTAAHVPSNAVPAVRRLVRKALQPMRNKFGQCSVNSGFRNKVHNQHVGGESDSHHRYDLHPTTPAADVTFETGTVAQWAAEARRLLPGVGGIGRYPGQNFVHVDLGPKRVWDG
jgi:hypothetical protein